MLRVVKPPASLSHMKHCPYQALAKALIDRGLRDDTFPEYHTFAALQQSVHCIAFQTWPWTDAVLEEKAATVSDWLFSKPYRDEAQQSADPKCTTTSPELHSAAASFPNWPIVGAVAVIAVAAGYLIGRKADTLTLNID